MDRTVNTTSAEQRAVCRVDDSIGVFVGDVTDLNDHAIVHESLNYHSKSISRVE
jgi:hypothetical protein